MIIAAPAAAQTTAAERKPFDIRPQSLQNALTVLGQQAGVQVTVDAAAVRGLSTRGVKGSLTPQAAAERVLAGTGLSYEFSSPTTLLVVQQRREISITDDVGTDLEEINVFGERANGPVVGYRATRTAT